MPPALGIKLRGGTESQINFRQLIVDIADIGCWGGSPKVVGMRKCMV